MRLNSSLVLLRLESAIIFLPLSYQIMIGPLEEIPVSIDFVITLLSLAMSHQSLFDSETSLYDHTQMGEMGFPWATSPQMPDAHS